MVLRLAAEASKSYAAVAAIAAANPLAGFSKKPDRPISVLLMNGTKDRICPYNGGRIAGDRGAVQSTDKSIEYWVEHNDCGRRAVTHQFLDKANQDRSIVLSKTYKNRSSHAEVKLYQITGGGHTEPSIEQGYSRIFLVLVGPQNRDIEMADEVWSFFKRKINSPSPIEQTAKADADKPRR